VYSPGEHTFEEREFSLTWESQLEHVKNWATYLKREIDAPDLWGQILNEKGLAEAALSAEDSDAAFTAKEQQYISSSLREIKDYLVSKHHLHDEQARFVEERLDILEKESKRQGRQAWLHTTIGVLFTIIIGISLAPDAARDLFKFATQALSKILHGSYLLP
jgi:hypothetical protein